MLLDDLRLVLGGHSGGDVVPADVEGLRDERSLQESVHVLGHLIDEQGGDGVHLQQIRLQVAIWVIRNKM